MSHSFLVIPECPASLLGRDLLTKVNAQIHFDPGGMSVTDGLGQLIHVLSLALRLFVPKPSEVIASDVQPWVHKYPLAWAETDEGKEVKNLPEIRRLLEAVQLPRAVAIVHVPGHQKGKDPKTQGNRGKRLAGTTLPPY